LLTAGSPSGADRGQLLKGVVNVLDKLMNTAAGFMEKVSTWISFPTLPWADFATYWAEFVDMIAPWNKVFPLTDIMTIIGLILGFSAAMMVLWTVAFIKSFIPMSGGK
jgi:hypothetical protein